MLFSARLKRTLSIILFLALLPACSIPRSNNSNTESAQPDGLIEEVVVAAPTAISQKKK